MTVELVLARMYGGDGPSVKKVSKKVVEVVGARGDVVVVSPRVIEVELDGNQGDFCGVLKAIGRVEGVVGIEKKMGMVLYNSQEAIIGQSGGVGGGDEEGRSIWSRGLMGQGEIGGIADTGIDTDSCYFRDGDSKATEEFEGCDMGKRKVVCYFTTRGADFGDDVGRERFSSGGHGSHTSGSMAGLHASIQPSKDANVTFDMLVKGDDFSNGVAPLSRIAFTDIGAEGFVRTPVDFASDDFFANGYNEAEARVFSISWGCERPQARLCNRYDISARSIDEFVWNNKDFLLVMAAGNTGFTGADLEEGEEYKDGAYTVSSPSTAKNVLTVGASENDGGSQDSLLPQNCRDSEEPCSIENIFGSSSRGPTFDGRTKPDVFFPGSDVMSASSSGNFQDFTDGRSCRRDADPKEGVVPRSGTSMSAPLVSGLALLVRQYYREYDPVTGLKFGASKKTGPLRDGKGPSAALVRATLINGARSFEGKYTFMAGESADKVTKDISDVPNRRQVEGFGRVQLDSVLKFANVSDSPSLFAFDRYKLDRKGQALKFVFDMTGSGTLKVTLSWTDPPGPLRDSFDTKSTLINDLDLEATCSRTANSTTQCSGISVDKPFAESKSSADNVEQISLEETANPLNVTGGGRITVVVRTKQIETGPQPFAMVVSGTSLKLVDSETAKANWTPDWGREAKIAEPKMTRSTIYILSVAGGLLILAAVATLITFMVRKRRSNR